MQDINFFLISEKFLFDIPYAPLVFQVTSVYNSASYSGPIHLEALLDDGHLSALSVQEHPCASFHGPPSFWFHSLFQIQSSSMKLWTHGRVIILYCVSEL